MDVFCKDITIHEDVEYCGEDADPKNNLGFQIWEKSLKEVIEHKKPIVCKICKRNRSFSGLLYCYCDCSRYRL